ncbi:hypothetical protein [Saccharolobus islandicus]|uniref:hypothetical protein n=1 Tax=Saccharolobus islandicus TaxID=43080 RepID=UPI00036F4511|nr:hypothetical protein [Sulfolobus islandicus]
MITKHIITKYPEHLAQESRLKVVKAYVLHELASLTHDKNPNLIDIDDLIKKCRKHEKGIEDDCKEIYDLFYGLSLMFKRKFIAKEITAESCKWEEGKVKLRDLIISTEIEGFPGYKYKTIEEIMKNEEIKRKICEEGKKYGNRRGKLADDPIIVVKENGNKYRILDGNGRVFYKLSKENCDIDKEINAYIGECNEIRNICVPFGIPHFIEGYIGLLARKFRFK